MHGNIDAYCIETPECFETTHLMKYVSEGLLTFGCIVVRGKLKQLKCEQCPSYPSHVLLQTSKKTSNSIRLILNRDLHQMPIF